MDCRRGYLPGIHAYISSGANINIKIGCKEKTPLLVVCLFNHVKCVELLLQHGADTNIATIDEIRPLHMASMHGHHECIELLLQHGGIDINYYYILLLLCDWMI